MTETYPAIRPKPTETPDRSATIPGWFDMSAGRDEDPSDAGIEERAI
jgi:hypothetical protein